ncbi:MAG: glycerol kinase GlpK [Acidimicrobiia bacterium]|nr:MAG: glycerol kinase GlpK [Acidimicrobiia bacterium]
MARYVGAIDQGTTSTRFVIVDEAGSFVSASQKEHEQILPRPGWVEHDADEIWTNTRAVVSEGLERGGLTPGDLAGVGITNQRETTLLWDTSTGMPLSHAVVWQDIRTADIVKRLTTEHGVEWFRSRTGLPPATYFAGPKIRWLLDNDPDLNQLVARGDLAFGTMDTWLAWNLTGRHVTDVTNASRTMLMDIETLAWDEELCDALGVPLSILPEIVPSIGPIGPCRGPLEGTELSTILGDQHAALVGQAGFGPGDTKATFGTGAFLVTNTGPSIVRSTAGLLTTVAYQIAGTPAMYALEGSVAVAGSAVQWLRDNLGLISTAQEIESVAESVPDNGDVYFVPAFSGLFAPHWRDDARGVMTGLTRFSNRGHFARAVLEATAFQTQDLVAAMEKDTGQRLTELRVDGGMVNNALLMQFMAGLLSMDVVVPSTVETTVMGAAIGAGIATGLWAGTGDVADLLSEATRYRPAMGDVERDKLLSGWSKALERSFGWIDA